LQEINARGRFFSVAARSATQPKKNTKMKLEHGHNTSTDDHGTIIKDDGEIIDLTQEAYIDGTNDSPFYRAAAVSRTRVDADGDPVQYHVFWSLKEGAEDLGDESEACDWDDFELEEKIGRAHV
jgi:hypothetical protein